MRDRKSTKYRQGYDPSPDPRTAMGAAMGSRSNGKPPRSPAEGRRHRSRDLEMQGLEAALSHLWEGGGEGMRRRNCLPLARASYPPLLPHISLHS